MTFGWDETFGLINRGPFSCDFFNESRLLIFLLVFDLDGCQVFQFFKLDFGELGVCWEDFAHVFLLVEF